MVEWNGIFRLLRFSRILGQPREVHPKFRNEIRENDCSIRSPTRNFRNFWSNGKRPRGPFLERPGNLTGPKSYFEIKFSRKVGCVLTSNEVNFVSLADNFTVQFSNFWNYYLEWKTKLPNGPDNYRELRETGPRSFTLRSHTFFYSCSWVKNNFIKRKHC